MTSYEPLGPQVTDKQLFVQQLVQTDNNKKDQSPASPFVRGTHQWAMIDYWSHMTSEKGGLNRCPNFFIFYFTVELPKWCFLFHMWSGHFWTTHGTMFHKWIITGSLYIQIIGVSTLLCVETNVNGRYVEPVWTRDYLSRRAHGNVLQLICVFKMCVESWKNMQINVWFCNLMLQLPTEILTI